MILPKPSKRGPKAKKRVCRQKKTSRAKLIRRADKMWADLVKRPGVCEFSREGLFPEVYPHECGGPLQAQHGIPRTHHATRWVLLNGFSGCKSSHHFWGYRQALWGLFLAEAWGPLVAEELWRRARSHEVPDMEKVVAELEAYVVLPTFNAHRTRVDLFNRNGEKLGTRPAR